MREKIDWEVLSYVYLKFLKERLERESRDNVWRDNDGEFFRMYVRYEFLIDWKINYWVE